LDIVRGAGVACAEKLCPPPRNSITGRWQREMLKENKLTYVRAKEKKCTFAAQFKNTLF
jgi:hypothetical protein